MSSRFLDSRGRAAIAEGRSAIHSIPVLSFLEKDSTSHNELKLEIPQATEARELGPGQYEVTMPFDTDYSFSFRQSRCKQCHCRIEIDGVDVGTFVFRSGRCELRRYLREDRAFRFVRHDSAAAQGEGEVSENTRSTIKMWLAMKCYSPLDSVRAPIESDEILRLNAYIAALRIKHNSQLDQIGGLVRSLRGVDVGVDVGVDEEEEAEVSSTEGAGGLFGDSDSDVDAPETLEAAPVRRRTRGERGRTVRGQATSQHLGTVDKLKPEEIGGRYYLEITLLGV